MKKKITFCFDIDNTICRTKLSNYNSSVPDRAAIKMINKLYEKTLSKNVVFTTGVGNHQMQAYQFIKAQYPNKILSSGSLGVMGAGLNVLLGNCIVGS